jgi:membrane associated rhomboid family serine protease
MGLDNREYVRNDPRSAGRWSPDAGSRVTRVLIVVNVAAFLAQMLTVNSPFDVTRWLVMDFEAIQRGQVWRLLTYAFCHSTSEFLHIVFNMIVLWWAGRAVESLYGPREFLRFYLVAAIASSVTYVLLGLAMGVVPPMLGASGCTMACFAVFAMHYPTARVLLLGILPIEARWLLVGYVVLDMWPMIVELTGGVAGGNVAHAAHLGGLAFGLWYKWSGTRIAHWFGFLGGLGDMAKRRARSKADVRLYDPDHEPPRPAPPRERLTRAEVKERVDDLLAKIHEQGETSLTDEEREFLNEASRQYR